MAVAVDTVPIDPTTTTPRRLPMAVDSWAEVVSAVVSAVVETTTAVVALADLAVRLEHDATDATPLVTLRATARKPLNAATDATNPAMLPRIVQMNKKVSPLRFGP